MNDHDRSRRGHGRGRSRGMLGADLPGQGWGGGRRRMRRGDIRRAILSALKDGPGHGYEVMRRLETRSGGIWRPSPGSVYPTLQMLEDEGLVRSRTQDGTRVYELTDAGTAEAATSDADLSGRAPWERGDGADGRIRTLYEAVAQEQMAIRQVASAGNPAQIDQGIEIVQRAKRELYQLLAGD